MSGFNWCPYPFWLKTPQGEAKAIAVIDYGAEDDLKWVCIQQEDPHTGECRTWHNSEIRFQANQTDLRSAPKGGDMDSGT